MIKKYIFSTLVLFSFFIGCSNTQNEELFYNDIDTIKEYVLDKENNITWTKEIEGEILLQDISSNSSIQKTEFYTPEAVKVLKNYQNPVFPSIDNFGSLNTENLSKQTKEFLNEFCTEISNNIYSNPDRYFKNSFIFNYVFFRKELIDNWPVFFNTEFPVLPEDFNQNTEESENNQDKKEPIPIFTKWYLGEPFVGEDLVEVPVRFFTQNGNIDVTIVMAINTETRIYQIVIDRWVNIENE